MNFFYWRRKNIARIPDDQLDRLKTEISLQCLTEGMGIVLKRHGADLLGLCLFHDDKEPSLVINPKHNLWHCHRCWQGDARGISVPGGMRQGFVATASTVEGIRRKEKLW